MSTPGDIDIVPLNTSQTYAFVADCDMPPGSWSAIFFDDEEAMRYAQWRRQQGAGDPDECQKMAMTAMRCVGTVAVTFENDEASVLG